MASLAEKLLELKKSEFNFSAAVQSDMAASLNNYVANENSNKVTSVNIDDKVVDFSFDEMGTKDTLLKPVNDAGVLPEIQPIAIPAIPAEDGYLQEVDLTNDDVVPGFFHQDSSDPFFKTEVFIPAAFDGTEATAIEAYKLEAAAIEGKKFLVDSFTVTQPDSGSDSGFTDFKGDKHSSRLSAYGSYLASGPGVIIDAVDEFQSDFRKHVLHQTKPDKDSKVAEEKKKAENANRYAFDPENPPKAFGQILAEGSNELQEAYMSGEVESKHNKTFNNPDLNYANNMAATSAKLAAEAKKLAAEKGKKEKAAAELAKEKAEKAAELAKEKAEKERLVELAKQRVNDAPGSENAKAIAKDIEKEKLTAVLNAQDEEKRFGKIGDELAREKKLNNEKIIAGIAAAEERRKIKQGLKLAQEKAEKERKQQNFESAKNNPTLGSNPALPSNIAAQMEENRKNELAGSNFVSDGSSRRGRGGGRKFRQGINEETGRLGDPFRFSTLSYPRNVTNNMANGHYLLFYVNVQNKTGYKYEGVTPTDGDFSIGDIVEKVTSEYIAPGAEITARESNIAGVTKGANKAYYKTRYTYEKNAKKGEINYQKNQVLSGGNGTILRHNQKVLSKGRKTLTGMAAQHKTTTRITDSVAMYLPANVQNDTSVQYEGFETGMAGFLALGGSGILDKIIKNDYVGAAGQFLGMGGTVLLEMLKKTGVASVSAFTGGQGIQESFDKAFGQTLNPYLEVAFTSMGVRSFNYEFTFSPRNEEESQDAKDIIELFRFHMAPELKGAQHRYLTLPSTFDIHYMYQTSPGDSRENDFYNKIATCVLTKVNVNYAPGDIQSFDSGAPVSTTMSLEFMETEMLTKEKIQQGF